MKFDFLVGLDTANMDEKTIEILRMMGKTVEDAMNNYLGDVISKKEFDTKIAELLAQFKNNEQLKSLEGQMADAQALLLKLKSSSEKGADGEVRIKSIEQQIEDQLKGFVTAGKNGTKTVDLRGACQDSVGYKKTLTLVIDTKTASTTQPVTSTGVAPHFGNQVDTQLSVEPRANTVLRQYANVAPTGSRTLTYAELKNVEGNAAWVPEGGVKPMMKGTLEEVTVTAAKVALGVKLTEETLTDLPQLVAEIRAEIINRIGLKEEAGILTGTGTGGEIKGVGGNLPAYSLTTIQIKNASIVDAIVAAYTQIVSMSEQNYVPNVVMINPIDWANMSREKDNTGRPLNERIADVLPTGLDLVTSTAVQQGKLLMGDFNFLNIRDYVVLQIQIGWENDDFTKNLVTLIGEKRLMTYIKNQYKTAFVYDDIANIIDAVTPA